MMLRYVTVAAMVGAVVVLSGLAVAGLVGGGEASTGNAAEITTLQVRASAGRDDEALRALERAARSGSAYARLALGQVLIGRGDSKAAAEGIAWLDKASNQGEMRAELSLGKLYLKGAPGVPANAARAAEHFERGATHGIAGAAYYLGLMYRNGNGVPRDSAKAAHWMETAALGDIPSAMFILANMYLAGEGVPSDRTRARDWLEKAAELEHPESNQMLAMGLRDGSLGLPVDEKKAAFQMMETAHSLKHRPIDP